MTTSSSHVKPNSLSFFAPTNNASNSLFQYTKNGNAALCSDTSEYKAFFEIYFPFIDSIYIKPILLISEISNDRTGWKDILYSKIPISSCIDSCDSDNGLLDLDKTTISIIFNNLIPNDPYTINSYIQYNL